MSSVGGAVREEPTSSPLLVETSAAPVDAPTRRRGLLARLRMIRIPIRLKLLGVLIALSSLISMVIASSLLALVTDDKATYIRDRNAEFVANAAASIELLIKSYGERVRRAGELLDSAAEPGPLLSEWFEASEELIHLSIYDDGANNILTLLRWRALHAAEVDVDGFHKRRRELEPTVGYLRAHRLWARNSTDSALLPTVSIALPYYSKRYEKWFSICADIRANQLQSVLRRAPSNAFVVSQDSFVFVHTDSEQMVDRPTAASHAVVQVMLSDMAKSAGAAAQTGEFVDADGEATLASWALIRDTGLGLVVERRKSDAMVAADRLIQQSIRSALWVVAIAGVFSWFLARAATRSLLALSHVARSLERGDFDVRVAEESNDELGDLARSFNLAARGLREREEKLKGAYEQLLQSEKLAGFGKFSAGIAHEIKNPLTGILGFAQILQRKVGDNESIKRPLVMIEKEAKRCKSILDNLLKFTRKESFQLAPLSLHEHIRETLDLLEPQFTLQRVRLEVDLSAPQDEIRGDSNQLRQVFMNLLLNAIDAMEMTEDRVIRVGTHVTAGDDGYVTAVVTDSGTGIPEGVLRKVFDPFFSTKEPGKGTGLGLSVTYGIITNHGGRVRVNNAPPLGAQFELILPLNPEVDARSAREAVAAGAAS